MTATYDSIATTTLGSAASTIAFSSIPNTYTDLRLVFYHKGSGSGVRPLLRFNSNTASNYSQTRLSGNGSSAASDNYTSNTYILFSSDDSSTNGELLTADIFSYAGSTNKSLLATQATDNNGSGIVMVNVGLWRSTSAITTVNLVASGGNFATGSTATLYGIKSE